MDRLDESNALVYKSLPFTGGCNDPR